MTRIHPAKKIRLEAEEAERQQIAAEKERLQKKVTAMERQEDGLFNKKTGLMAAVVEAKKKVDSTQKELGSVLELLELARLVAPEEVPVLVTELDPLTQRHLVARNEWVSKKEALSETERELDGVSRALFYAKQALRNVSDELRFSGRALTS